MAENDASKVGIGAAGKVYIAPKGTTLPTDATTDLATVSEAYVNFGYVSDAGVTMSESDNTNTIRAWGGDAVVTTLSEHTETVAFTPIEINETVLKALYGDDNVDVTAGSGSTPTTIVAKHKGQTMPQVVIVIEAIPNAGTKARYVMPLAQLTARGDASLTGTAVQGREMTYTGAADANGVTLYEYQSIQTA